MDEERRTLSGWEARRLAVVTVMVAFLAGDLVTLHGLLLLCAVGPTSAAVVWGWQLRPHSAQRRARIRQARRHIEELETELGWREKPSTGIVQNARLVVGYYQTPAGAVITGISAASYPVKDPRTFVCARCGFFGGTPVAADQQMRHCQACNYTGLFGVR